MENTDNKQAISGKKRAPISLAGLPYEVTEIATGRLIATPRDPNQRPLMDAEYMLAIHNPSKLDSEAK